MRRLLVSAAIAILLVGAAHAGAPDRIRFLVTTIEESGTTRNTLSEASVDGPPGTDFTIRIESEPLRMVASFRTDLAGEGLRVRARLETRRLYGRSERGLPLYEEDRQRHRLRLGFHEELVLLPFGGLDADERLVIRIVAEARDDPSGADGPLEIDLLKPSVGGLVTIQAEKVPHRYEVVAEILGAGVDRADPRRGGGRGGPAPRPHRRSPEAGASAQPGPGAVRSVARRRGAARRRGLGRRRAAGASADL
jgi:hypothetical protein